MHQNQCKRGHVSGTGSRQERKERGVLFLVMLNWSFCSDHLGELLSWCLWSTAELHIKTIKVWMFTVLIFICIFIFYVKFLSDWFWNQRLGADAKKELRDALLCFLDALAQNVISEWSVLAVSKTFLYHHPNNSVLRAYNKLQVCPQLFVSVSTLSYVLISRN